MLAHLLPLDVGDYAIPLPDVSDILTGAKELVVAFGPFIGMFATVGVGLLVVGSIIGFFRG